MLENVRVVMVETTHPGNIGAAARAMKTMGLADLRLVSPAVYPSAEATAPVTARLTSAIPVARSSSGTTAPRSARSTSERPE